MSVSNELSQRRIGLRYRFEIGEASVKYSARDVTGERTIEIPYESINFEQPAFVRLTATPVVRRLLGCSLLLLLMAAVAGAFDLGIALIWVSGAFALFVATIIAKLTGWSDIKLKLFDFRPYPPGAIGPMRVIDDSKGAEIIATLRKAQKARFRRLHAEANFPAQSVDDENPVDDVSDGKPGVIH